VVEHFLDTEGVRGSNPLSRTIFLNLCIFTRVWDIWTKFAEQIRDKDTS